MGASDGNPSFGSVVRDAVRLRDCLGLAAVPAVVVAVFVFLPPSTRSALAFEYADPSPVTAYAAHFVHFGVDHLVANVVGFVLLAGSAYLLAVLADRRRLFGAAAVTYLAVFPPVLSALNLAVSRDAVGYGLSGVNMAFAGLLGLLLVAYARRRVDARVRLRYAPAVFFAATAVVSLLALPLGAPAVGLAAVCALAATGYVLAAWRRWPDRADTARVLPGRGRRDSRDDEVPETRRGADVTGQSGRWFDLGVLAVVVFFGGLYVAFPDPGAGDGVVVNLYVHLLGFCLGFVVPFVAVELGGFAGTDAGA